MAKMACSGCLVPHFINNDYVTAEIFIAVHMRILRYSLGHGLCEVHIYMSSCIMAMSVGLVMRGENTARILLWLVRQPGERSCAFMLYHVCCYSCRASQKKINLPAVPMALCVFFQPLSSRIAYSGFNKQCAKCEQQDSWHHEQDKQYKRIYVNSNVPIHPSPYPPWYP